MFSGAKEILKRLEGRFVSELTPAERRLFELAVGQGEARRDLSGVSGYMGHARVVRVERPAQVIGAGIVAQAPAETESDE